MNGYQWQTNQLQWASMQNHRWISYKINEHRGVLMNISDKSTNCIDNLSQIKEFQRKWGRTHEIQHKSTSNQINNMRIIDLAFAYQVWAAVQSISWFQRIALTETWDPYMMQNRVPPCMAENYTWGRNLSASFKIHSRSIPNLDKLVSSGPCKIIEKQ